MKKYKKDLLFPISLFFVLMIFSSLLYYFEIPNKSVSSLDRSNLSATVYNTLSNINGNSFIYSTDRSIQVVTSDYLAGAVSALIWNGKQYINDIGHGASLQYVVSVNGLGENYNPTEAGGRHDDYNLRQLDDVRTSDLALQNNTMIAPPWAPYSQPVLTSSILEQFSAGAQTASSRSRMAFWNTKSSLRSTWTDVNGIHYYPPAINTSTTSNYVISKNIAIEPVGLSNVIKMNASISVPPIDSEIRNGLNDPNYVAPGSLYFQKPPTISISAPTGYLVKDFSKYYELINATSSSPLLKDISGNHGTSLDEPYRTKNPIIYSTQDNNYAMGVYSLSNTIGIGSSTYMTYVTNSAFSPNLSKWSVDYEAPLGVSTTTLSFTTYVVVGKVSDVQARLVSLITGKPLPAVKVSSCLPTPASVSTGVNVKWNAIISGGVAPYTVFWNNNDGGVTDTHTSINSASDSKIVAYSTSGTKYMGIAVIDSKGQKADWMFCPSSVNVTTPPPPPRNVPIVSSCAPTPATANIGSNVKWTANISGGTAPYTFYWNNSATNVTNTHTSVSGTSDSETVTYNASGMKYMGLAVIDSKGQKADWAFCPGVVNITGR